MEYYTIFVLFTLTIIRDLPENVLYEHSSLSPNFTDLSCAVGRAVAEAVEERGKFSVSAGCRRDYTRWCAALRRAVKIIHCELVPRRTGIGV